MNIEIKKYNELEDYSRLLELIESEGEEWRDYLQPKYRVNLQQSITYVAYTDETLCGYSRSMNDCDFYIWVIDLLVGRAYRGHSIGRKLLECIRSEFPNHDAFVMSDVDGYYEKLGYAKEGSIFKIK